MAFGDLVPQTFITQFEAEAKIAYGNAAKMRPVVRSLTATGSKVSFPTLLTDFAAVAKARGAALTYNDGAHGKAEASMFDYFVPALVEEFDQFKTNVDLRGTYVKHIGNALAQIHDKQILATLNGWDALPDTTPATYTALTDDILDKLIDVSGTMNNNNVPMTDRTFVVKASYLSTFLKNSTVTSGDFNSIKALVNGDLKQFMGFNWVMLPDSYFTGATTVGFAIHKEAVGVGVCSDINVKIDWVPQLVAHQVLGTLSMGSTIIDAKGIVEIKTA